MTVPIRIVLAEDSTDEGGPSCMQGLRRAGYEPTAIRPDDSPLGRERDLLRLVLDANPDLMFVKDSRGHFTMANRAVAERLRHHRRAADRKVRERRQPAGQGNAAIRCRRAGRDSSGRPTFVDRRAGDRPAHRLDRAGSTSGASRSRSPRAAGRQVLGIAVETTDRRIAESALRAAKTRCGRPRRWRPSGSWPAASHTSSTTC